MPREGKQCPAQRLLSELYPCYSNDFVCTVVDVWDAIDYTHAYVVDYTEQPELAVYASERCLPGNRNLKVELHEPHRSYFKKQWQNGEIWGKVYKFSNVRTKFSKGLGTLEGTMWVDKQQSDRINIRPLPNSDPAARQLLQRKHEYQCPPKPNGKRKRQREQKKAQQALDQEAARERDSSKRRKVQPAESTSEGPAPPSPRPAAIKAPVEAKDAVSPEEAKPATSTTRDVMRACMKETKNHIGTCLSDLNTINAMNLTTKLLSGVLDLSASIVKDLHRPSTSDPKASLTLRPLCLSKELDLESRSTSDAMETAMYARKFHDLGADVLSKPWALDKSQALAVQYPTGYEAFAAVGPPELNPRVQVPDASARAAFSRSSSANPLHLSSTANPATTAECIILDFSPRHISQFAQRLSSADDGAPTHGGDRFSFWLLLWDVRDPTHRPFWSWVSNTAAEQLVGMSATHVLEGREDGLARLRARLRELWGCFEFCKETWAAAHGDDSEDAEADAAEDDDRDDDRDEDGDGESNEDSWEAARWKIMGRPLVQVGLRALPVRAETVAEVAGELDDEVGSEALSDSVLYLLEGTTVVLGDL